MKRIGFATLFVALIAACAVETADPAASAERERPSATSSPADVAEAAGAHALQPGPIKPHLCISFYQGAGNYYQCDITGQWFHGGTANQCIAHCSGGSCTEDVICGPGGACDCEGN